MTMSLNYKQIKLELDWKELFFGFITHLNAKGKKRYSTYEVINLMMNYYNREALRLMEIQKEYDDRIRR